MQNHRSSKRNLSIIFVFIVFIILTILFNFIYLKYNSKQPLTSYYDINQNFKSLFKSPDQMEKDTSINRSALLELNGSLYKMKNGNDFYIGLLLALLSSFFIGSSFILKKKGLLKLVAANSGSNSLRAGQGGYGYLKEGLWWAGLITMGIGELCNFAAYGFAPATLVTPLGALSVLVSAIMASYFLNEKLNSIGKIGCVLTGIGSTVMVIHAPKEGDVKSLYDLLLKLKNIEFLMYLVVSTISVLVLMFILSPRYGTTNIIIYILICSILGSFTVMSCKGLSIGIKELLNPSDQLTSPYYVYIFLFITIFCIVIQMNYLNKSLDIFNTAIVTTVYYVLFTLCVMIASSILFNELSSITYLDFLGCCCGFATIICALCLIHFFKTDLNDTTIQSQLSIEENNSNCTNLNLNESLVKRVFTNINKKFTAYRGDVNSNSDNMKLDTSYVLLSTHGDDDDDNESDSSKAPKLV